MIGQTLGHYRVLDKLGEGGMGVVYRAHDEQLDRDVALKVLPAEALADQTARTRLLREARLASKLNHPHICTIYEVGEVDGQAYIAMELVEGQTLSGRLAEGALPVEQVLRYGQQMADALAHAHARRVIHRDFKSANVVITPEGRAKVLDFGLARHLSDTELADVTTVSRHSLTQPGVVAGTLAYMAPEQLKGQPADERSDIWALGMVLYELAAGQRPFQGQTGFELTSAILKEPPPPLPTAVPAPLQAVVARCLAKDPGERYQGGSDVQAALEAVQVSTAVAPSPGPRRLLGGRRILGAAAGTALLVILSAVMLGFNVGGVRARLTGGGTAPVQAVRLAVLPFANLSGDAAQEYLGSGLTEDVISQLGSLHPERLHVIARTSVMRYKKGDAPVDQIGRELGVDYILEGSAQREANRVRITVRLIRVRDQSQIWARPYEHELSGIMVIQSELAKSVAEALALKLLPAEKDRLASARTVNPEAYDAYQKGSSLWKTLKPADLDAAQRYFEEALVKDPSYAQAFAGLAWVWLTRQYPARAASLAEAGPKASAAALQAVALDGNSAEAHEALARVKTTLDWDWAGAEPEWRRALELNPNAANAHAYYALFLDYRGRTSEAIVHIERALELDPFNALYHCYHSITLQYLRRYDDALAAARKALSIQPDLEIAQTQFQYIYIIKGMRNEQLADQRLRIARDPERLAAFERGFAKGGYDGAQLAVADVLAARYKNGYYDSAPGIALRYLDGGDADRAIDWLYRAYESRDPGLLAIGRPHWDRLRNDPRFQALLRRIGLPQ